MVKRPLEESAETLDGLPSGWRTVPLREVLAPVDRSIRRLQVKDGERYSLLSTQLYAKGVVLKDEVAGVSLKTKNWFRVREGDFLLLKIWARKGSYGFMKDDIPNAIVSSDYPILEFDHTEADQGFVEYYLSMPCVWRSLAIGAKGSTNRQRVHETEFLRLVHLPLPSLGEQRTIAHVLRTVQRAKEATEKVIAATRQLKQSLMRHLFTYGPVPFDQADQVPLKETEIGRVPEHWKMVPLGRIGRIGNGSTPKRSNQRYWENGTIPWLTSGKVHETVIEHADEFVTDVARTECHLPLVKKGSIVVAITGQGKTLGNAALVTFDTCVSQHLAYIQFEGDAIQPEFMLYFLQGQYDRFRQVSQGGGSTKGALTCGFLKGYEVTLPPPEDQKKIAATLGSIEQKLKAEEIRRLALDALFQSLLHHLMTGKVRVHGLYLPTAGGVE